VGKWWLAIGGAALLIVLLLMWRQLDPQSATAAPPPKASEPVRSDPLAEAKAVAAAEHAKAGIPEKVVPPPNPDGKPEKIDVESDEFFYKFQEVVPAVLSRGAAPCYDALPDNQHVKMNSKLTLQFHIKIKDGEVTVTNVHASADTLGNSALSTCFTQAVQRGGWHDDALPDWEADDELLIRPERGFKKYLKSNTDYVGAPAPRQDNSVERPN